MTVMAPDSEIDADRVRREVEARVNVWVGDERMMEDEDDTHAPWLLNRPRDDWRFWLHYRDWLLRDRKLPPTVVANLDRLTDRILDGLGDPDRPGAWDRRGMVVGQVQSGKTGNYTGLVCKAADAGYKLIVVLAGLHNSLRSQTQLRLDEGVLGLDPQQSRTYDQTKRPNGG